MTPAEFAGLTVTQQCDVWAAADCGLVGWREPGRGQPRQYDRAQVAAGRDGVLGAACAPPPSDD